MNNRFSGLSLAIFLMTASAINAGAEETKLEAKPAQKAEQASLAKSISKLEDMKEYLGLNTYLQGGYTYNFRKPDSGINEQRLFDRRANTFLIDLAQIQFLKEPVVGGFGFKLKLSAGETAKFIHSAGLGNQDDEFDLTEAYVDYVAPAGKGLKVRFGKFSTFLGAETVEAKENLNYSHSFLYDFGTPFTHTGFMSAYQFSDAFTANLYLVNGWDVTNDNNKGKSVGASLVVTPIGPIQLTFNFMHGPEQDNSTSNNRFIFDWIGAFKATKSLTFMVNVDYAREQRVALNAGKDAEWYGIAAYAKYEFMPDFSVAVRAEYFNDKDGVRTGIAQELKEITFTPEYKLTKTLLLRPEYRHDWSAQNAFDSRHGTFDRKTQDTIAIGVMHSW
jgi:hypothetical protein